MRIVNICLALTAVILVISSCSGVDKLLKGRDYEKQYTEALRFYNLKKNSKAIALFSNVETIFQGTERIDTIKFYKAKAHYRDGDFTISSELFDEFRKIYTRSPFAEEAEFLYAMSFYESSPNPELDQMPSISGIEAFNEYLSRYPDSPKKESCLEMIKEMEGRLYDKAFVIANTYYNVGYYNSAIHSYKNVLKQYPNIPQREQIMFLLVKSNYLYAKSSVHAKQRERYLNTVDSYYNFLSEYPESRFSKDAERLYKTSQRLAKLKISSEGADSTSNIAESRRIEKQERKATKIADKASEKKITLKSTQTKAQKLIAKKLAAIEAKIEKEQKREAQKKSVEEKLKTIPTEISATGKEIIRDTSTPLSDVVKKEPIKKEKAQKEEKQKKEVK